MNQEAQGVEEALRESQELFLKAFHASPAALAISRLSDGTMIDVNQRYVRLFGFPREELVGRKGCYREIYPDPTVRERLVEVVQREGRIVDHLLQLESRSGRLLHVELSVEMIRHLGETCLLTMCSDVTRRVQAEEKLRRSEEKFSMAFRLSPTSMAITRLSDGRIVEINEAFERTFGYARAGSLGRTVHELGAWVDPEERASIVADHRTTGTTPPREIRLRARDGGIRTCLAAWERLSIDGEAHALAVFDDVTERRQAEARRLELEQSVQQMQKLESLGILAGGIAHDFNNLLGGIFGNLELALGHCPADGPARAHVETALETYHRAKDLTRQLLTFAKGGSPVRKTGSVTPFLRDTVRFALSGSSCSCVLDIPENLWSCDFDEHQLSQVVDNLVINSLQAMPSGGELAVSARGLRLADGEVPPLPAGRYVRISVRDSGTGIAADDLSRVFDPFFTTKENGTGLGLSTSYSIVRKHGGVLTAESTPGQGAVFHIHLPAAADRTSSDPPVPPAEPLRSTGRILVVDDEETVRRMSAKMLESLGYHASLVPDGEAALATFDEALRSGRPFDAVVLDLTIPGGMGGKQTISALRRIHPAVVAIASSGYSDDAAMADPTAFGFDDGLAKPFLRAELADVLARHLARRSNAGSGPSQA